jgi:hypothetical protein
VDDVTATLLGTLADMAVHAADPGPATSATRIDRIAAMEQIRSALAAAQHAEMVAFGRQQVEEQIAQGVAVPRIAPARDRPCPGQRPARSGCVARFGADQ